MSKGKRTDRVSGVIQRKLANLIQREVKDPRLTGFVTLTEVKVSSDLSYAKVYFTIYNQDKDEATKILNQAAGYLRTQLAKTVELRTVPELQFLYDETIEYGQHLSRLIDKSK